MLAIAHSPQEMQSLLPKYARGHMNENEWMSLCVESVKKLIKHGLENYQTSIDYERQFLKVVQTHNLYGMTYFPVTVTQPGRYRKHDIILLGINWKHIVFRTLEYEIIKQMSMQNLKSIKQDQDKPNTIVVFKHRDKTESKVTYTRTMYDS